MGNTLIKNIMMKTALILILSTTLFFYSNAQSITLTFNGTPGTPSTILIENLTNGTNTTLQDINTITLNSANSVNEINNENTNAFPNPFVGETTVHLEIEKSSIVNIQIANQTGKIITKKTQYIQKGSASLKFLPAKKGLYFINIYNSNFKKTFSVICEKSKAKKAKITIQNTTIRTLKNKSSKNLTFSFGDRLKYTAEFDNKFSVMTDCPQQTKTYNFEFYDCIDYELNVYPTTKIGTQVWMAENLKSTKYSDGTNINNSYAYNDIYGRNYTWTAAMKGASAGNNNNPSGIQGVCPIGWHMPSESEWDQLRDELGGWELMGGKLKETGTAHWTAPNSDATNETGMSILPAGIHWTDDGFQYIGEQAFYWDCSDFDDLDSASGYTFWSETPADSYYLYTFNLKTSAQSVRCVKD